MLKLILSLQLLCSLAFAEDIVVKNFSFVVPEKYRDRPAVTKSADCQLSHATDSDSQSLRLVQIKDNGYSAISDEFDNIYFHHVGNDLYLESFVSSACGNMLDTKISLKRTQKDGMDILEASCNAGYVPVVSAWGHGTIKLVVDSRTRILRSISDNSKAGWWNGGYRVNKTCEL